MANYSKSGDTSDTSSTTSSKRLKNEPKPPSKRRNTISVCLANCRYEIFRKIVSRLGYKEVSDDRHWNLYLTSLSVSIERCKDMKRYQKINHFPGMSEICRKDLLARNLNRMLRLFPRDYNFFPRTWCIPHELDEALTYSRLHRNTAFILKPEAGSQGRGIFVTKTLTSIETCDRGVCQVYINTPYLIDGYKFDLRVYVLITSCDPLRIYVHNEGLVRFATTRYKKPNSVNARNIFMHLTNYAVNKYSQTYNEDAEEGSKRKLSWLKSYLQKLHQDADTIWKRINDVIIKTIISAVPVLKHNYAACFSNHDVIPACYELLGIDIILDSRLNPQILEVNHSPSFHTDTALDLEIKESLLTDVFSMINLEKCDKRKIMREDRKRTKMRLLGKDYQTASINFEDLHKEEMKNRGGFKLIFPCPTTKNHYNQFFCQGQGSFYSQTATSRARAEAQSVLKDEMRLKKKLEVYRRIIIISNPKQKPSKKDESTQVPLFSRAEIYSLLPRVSVSEPQMKTCGLQEEQRLDTFSTISILAVKISVSSTLSHYLKIPILPTLLDFIVKCLYYCNRIWQTGLGSSLQYCQIVYSDFLRRGACKCYFFNFSF